jgi:hypothetical protein
MISMLSDVKADDQEDPNQLLSSIVVRILKDLAKDRGRSYNLYHLLYVLQEYSEPLGLTHTTSISDGNLVYQINHLNPDWSVLARQVLTMIFKEQSTIVPNIQTSSDMIKIIVPLHTDNKDPTNR